jgi:SNF2 family DNA or RNA helicase
MDETKKCQVIRFIMKDSIEKVLFERNELEKRQKQKKRKQKKQPKLRREKSELEDSDSDSDGSLFEPEISTSKKRQNGS